MSRGESRGKNGAAAVGRLAVGRTAAALAAGDSAQEAARGGGGGAGPAVVGG